MQTAPSVPFEVQLDEDSGEANGAAYLLHMLLSQQQEADGSGGFALQARRLKPVHLTLADTGESCVVFAADDGLLVSSSATTRAATSIRAESRHLIDVTQLRLAGRLAITGPLGDRKFRGTVADILRHRLVIKGLIVHYLNTMRFLWLVNIRRNESNAPRR